MRPLAMGCLRHGVIQRTRGVGAVSNRKGGNVSAQTELFATVIVPEDVLVEIFDSSERAATIVAAAMIDDELESKIQSRLLPDKDPRGDRLFDQGEAALGSFNAKILLAARLGIIDPHFEKLLHRFRDRIRNKYAHRSILAITAARDSLVDDFFLAQLKETTNKIENNACYKVSGSYACTGMPLNDLLFRKRNPTTPRDVSYRIMLLAMLGRLSDLPPNTPGGVRVGATFCYARSESGSVAINEVCLCCDRIC